MKSFNDAFDFVVGAEGGFGNDRHDRGNWDTGIVGDGNLKGTKFGISAMSYPGLDIKKLTLEDARKIYYDDYWHPMRCHLISYPKGLCLFDSAVNQGKRRASRFAQKSAGVTDDGIIGNQTLDNAMVNVNDPPEHMRRVADCQYAGKNDACNHAMNDYRKCSDTVFCIVAIIRDAEGHRNIEPCGLLSGESCEGQGNFNATVAVARTAFISMSKHVFWRLYFTALVVAIIVMTFTTGVLSWLLE